MDRAQSAVAPDVTELKREFETTGYAVSHAHFSPEEVEKLNEHFAEIHRSGADGRYTHLSEEEAGEDVLKAYPRVMNPHRYSDLAREKMTTPMTARVLEALFEETPLAVQSMYYFKPPGSRGQKMHQDQFYLQVSPGTCIAMWVALDHVTRENGGMVMVPLTQNLPIDCSKVGKAGSYDANGVAIRIPDGFHGESPELEPGDAIFFNGSLIHGSGGNHSADRWRRSFICHYAGVSCKTISKSYHPLVDMSGRDVERGVTTDGGPCGGWVGAAH